MIDQEADQAQQWKGMDGATAFHLIERHAEGWDEIRAMMYAWLRANQQDDVLRDAERYRKLRAHRQVDVRTIGWGSPMGERLDDLADSLDMKAGPAGHVFGESPVAKRLIGEKLFEAMEQSGVVERIDVFREKYLKPKP